MNGKVFIFLTIGILLLGTFFLVSDVDKEEEINVEYKLNDCNFDYLKTNNINFAVEEYEKLDCFTSYKLFEEVSE